MNDYFPYKTEDGEQQIFYSEIESFQAEGNYTRIHPVKGETILVCLQLNQVAAKLFPGHPFKKYHRSSLVNFKYVLRAGSTRRPVVMMKYGKPIRVRKNLISKIKSEIKLRNKGEL